MVKASSSARAEGPGQSSGHPDHVTAAFFPAELSPAEYIAAYKSQVRQVVRASAESVRLLEAGHYFEEVPEAALHLLGSCRVPLPRGTRVPPSTRGWLKRHAYDLVSISFRDILIGANQDLAKAGFDPPGALVKRWIHLGRVVEADPSQLTLGLTVACALAWMDRQRLKTQVAAGLAVTAKPPPPPPTTMLHSADFSQVIWGKEEFLFSGTKMRGTCLARPTAEKPGFFA